MTSRVVSLKPDKPDPTPVIRLRRAAPGESHIYPFLVGYVDERGTEDFRSLQEYQTYDDAVKAAEDYANRLRIEVADATGVKPEIKADTPAAKAAKVASAPGRKPSTPAPSKLDELPTLKSLFKLPDLSERAESVDSDILVNRAFALHDEQRDEVLADLNEMFGDSRSYACTYTQGTHDQIQGQFQNLYVHSEITKAIMYSYLELAFERIDELESKMLTTEGFGAQVGTDDRTVELSFGTGENQRVASFRWPTMIDRGVYDASKTYAAGDAVSHGGSLWVAQRDEPGKPGTPGSGFRLAVKKGADGKDATR